jgi:Cys-tRNA synthase (O-phospho-L-seryl-tRNA:Cys-tRNA synthase)
MDVVDTPRFNKKEYNKAYIQANKEKYYKMSNDRNKERYYTYEEFRKKLLKGLKIPLKVKE